MLRIVLWTDLYSSSGFACSLYKKAVLKGKPKEVKYVVAKKSQGTFYPVLLLNFLWPLTSRDRERIALSFFPCNRVQGSLLLLCQTAKWDKAETAKRGERMWLKIHQGRESVVEVVNT